MSALIPQNFGQVSSKFQQAPVDDLSSGIQSSFGLIGYKGKVWSIRYRGDETQLMRDDGDGPRGSIEVVVLKASPNISKIWYEQGYVEGSNAAPDCFSNNGVVPEPTSAKKQCDACALCPHNQWGSRVTPAGKAGKACADSKRLAVVPLQDLNNEAFGGPMLLRVPAASLQDVAQFGQKMQQMGYPYYSIGTKISFDPAESYPKFIFGGLRPLSDDEADVVLALRDSHTVDRILSEAEFSTPAATTPADDGKPLFEQAPGVGAAGTTANAANTTNNASVGDQARAAAAAQAQAQAQANQQAQAAATAAAAKAKKAAELKAQLAALAAEEEAEKQAAAKAAAEAQVTTKVTEPAPPVEPIEEEDEEMRQMEAALAAARARKAAAASGNSAATTTAVADTPASAVTQVTNATVSPMEADPQNMASSFEMDLDKMLADLIPAG